MVSGTSHTTVTDADGNVHDDAPVTGTVHRRDSTHYRPGDLQPIFTPDPPADTGPQASNVDQPTKAFIAWIRSPAVRPARRPSANAD